MGVKWFVDKVHSWTHFLTKKLKKESENYDSIMSRRLYSVRMQKSVENYFFKWSLGESKLKKRGQWVRVS